jgi:hypothetical protein
VADIEDPIPPLKFNVRIACPLLEGSKASKGQDSRKSKKVIQSTRAGFFALVSS